MLPSRLCFVLLSYVFSSAVEASQSVPTPKFPWIRRFSSIGDSYAAGLGAGERIDFVCSRFGKSHPNLLHTLYLGHNPERTHQFLACSGATATDIRQLQAPQLADNLDLLTISAGGNDVGLTPVLNDCVYQFYVADENACKRAIENAQNSIADETRLFDKILRLIAAATPKMNKTNGIIYVTGYAGFFGIDDNACDNVTWAVWREVGGAQKQFLRLETRKQLNDMVRSVNSVLRRATEAAGPRVRFIDYSAHIAKARGRFCEAGVAEPSPNRQGLAFHEWDTVDGNENRSALLLHTGADVPRGSFEGDIADWIQKTLEEHPDWAFDPANGYVNRSKIRSDGMLDDTVWWLLPDTWKRVFHLRPEAHAMIAQLIVDDLEGSKHAQEQSTVLLMRMQMAGAGGALIAMGLLLLGMCSRREEKTRGGYDIVPDTDDDDETLADADEQRDISTVKSYNMFA